MISKEWPMRSYRIVDPHARKWLAIFTLVYTADAMFKTWTEPPSSVEAPQADDDDPELPVSIEDLAEGLADVDVPRVITGFGNLVAPQPVVRAHATVHPPPNAQTADTVRDSKR